MRRLAYHEAPDGSVGFLLQQLPLLQIAPQLTTTQETHRDVAAATHLHIVGNSVGSKLVGGHAGDKLTGTGRSVRWGQKEKWLRLAVGGLGAPRYQNTSCLEYCLHPI